MLGLFHKLASGGGERPNDFCPVGGGGQLKICPGVEGSKYLSHPGGGVVVVAPAAKNLVIITLPAS